MVGAAWWWFVGLSSVGDYCLVFGYVVVMMFSCWFDCGLAGRWFVCCAGLLGWFGSLCLLRMFVGDLLLGLRFCCGCLIITVCYGGVYWLIRLLVVLCVTLWCCYFVLGLVAFGVVCWIVVGLFLLLNSVGI